MDKELQKILSKREISTNDMIIFRTIFDVLSALFTDENRVSTLKNDYNINDHQKVWFPNISSENKKELNIKNGYANYISEDWNYIYQFDSSKDKVKRKKQGEKFLQEKMQFVTFVKINEKAKGIGYHFAGIFVFHDFVDKECKTMIYKKINDSFKNF